MQVSIIIFYNKDRGWLNECIRAAENQIFNGTFELIIQKGDFNASKNYNDGIKRANGKYIRGCAEDDLLTPNCIQDLYDFAESGNYDVVCANAINFRDNNTEDVYKSVIPKTVSMLAEQNTIHGGTILYKRQSIIDVGLLNETLWTGEEWDLNLRLAANGYKFGYIDKVVFKYRIHKRMKSMQGGWTDSEKYIERFRYKRDKIQNKYIDNYKIIVK